MLYEEISQQTCIYRAFYLRSACIGNALSNYKSESSAVQIEFSPYLDLFYQHLEAKDCDQVCPIARLTQESVVACKCY